jgi:fused signal recognition particle receptor
VAFGFLKKLKDGAGALAKKAGDALLHGVKKTATAVRGGLDLLVGRKLNAEDCEQLEATLLAADFGPHLTMDLVDKAKEAFRDREIKSADEIASFLKTELKKNFPPQESEPIFSASGPTIVLVVGVNGTGKTTTIAKLAKYFTDQNQKVLLAAADTFRAAAVEQLRIWSERVGCEIVLGKEGADPASVAFNAVDKALAGKFDVVLIDTAGRLHNKKNLMDELEKISRVVRRKIADAPHEVLLTLDGTTGQNAVQQAKIFTAGVGVSGLIVTKLDGTAKGGAVLAMRSEIAVPVKWIGLGEKADDLQPFDADAFLNAVFTLPEKQNVVVE